MIFIQRQSHNLGDPVRGDLQRDHHRVQLADEFADSSAAVRGDRAAPRNGGVPGAWICRLAGRIGYDQGREGLLVSTANTSSSTTGPDGVTSTIVALVSLGRDQGPSAGDALLTWALDRRGDEACLALAGELDMSVAGQLDAALDTAFATDARSLTIDVGALRFIDSSGVGILVRACSRATAETRCLAVVNPRGTVLQVLRLMGLIGTLVQPPARTAGGVG